MATSPKLQLLWGVPSLQNTQCITVCCVSGCIAADQSGSPCWPLSDSCSFFTSRGWAGASASLIWGTHGTRIHYGKEPSQDALSNVLLRNLGSCHPCGCYFDTYHLPKLCCRPSIPFYGNQTCQLWKNEKIAQL